MAAKKELGQNAESPPKTWVQTERAAHESWAVLTQSNGKAAALLHVLVARMGPQNAVVASQKTLAHLVGCTDRTIRTALKVLTDENWIEVVKVNGTGSVAAYVINDRVAWGQPRADMERFSMFSAVVVADHKDQDPAAAQKPKLRKMPVLFSGGTSMPIAPANAQSQLELEE